MTRRCWPLSELIGEDEKQTGNETANQQAKMIKKDKSNIFIFGIDLNWMPENDLVLLLSHGSFKYPIV